MIMEPPPKRIRLSSFPPDPAVEFESEPVHPEPPNEELEAARVRNDQRLKSVFEGIFEKYGRDFSDIGDEIDLRTGEIVVDKGHLVGMRQEDDIGMDLKQLLGSEERHLRRWETGDQPAPSSRDGDDFDRMAGNNNTTVTEIRREVAPRAAYLSSESNGYIGDDTVDCTDESKGDATDKHTPTTKFQAATHVEQRSLLSPRQQLASIEKNILPNSSIEPIWQLPEIDAKFSTPLLKRQTPKQSQSPWSRPRSASPPGVGSLWALPSVGRPPKTDIPREKKPKKPKQKQRRKKPIVRDWSFAQLGADSDSDDPLQEDIVTSSLIKSSDGGNGRDSVTPTPMPTAGDETAVENWANLEATLDARVQPHSPVIVLDDEGSGEHSCPTSISRQPSREVARPPEESKRCDKRERQSYMISPSVKSAARKRASSAREQLPLTLETSKSASPLSSSKSQDLLVAIFDDEDDDESRSGISSIRIETTRGSRGGTPSKGSPLKTGTGG